MNTVPDYPPYALINRTEGAIDGEATFRALAQAKKVRFAMNVHDPLFRVIPEPPSVFVAQVVPVEDLERGDGIVVMSSVDVVFLLALIFSDEKRVETVLPKSGQIYLLCEGYDEQDRDEYTIILFWNDMRGTWEIQKFEGHRSPQPGQFILGPRVGEGRALAIAA